MFAIKKALRYIKNNGEGERWKILSDSRSALQALASMRKPTCLMAEVWKLYLEIRESTSVEFFWTKAHAGNKGNELADKYAKEAAESGSDLVFERAPFSVAKRVIRQSVIENWDEKWQNSDKGRFTFNFIKSIRERKSIKFKFTPQVTQAITGHGNFKSYLKRFGIRDEDQCTCGRGTEDAEHVLFECENTVAQRGRADAKLVSAGLRWPRNVGEISLYREEEEFRETFFEFCGGVASLLL